MGLAYADSAVERDVASVRLNTAEEGGTYHHVGQDIAEVALSTGMDVQVLPSLGTVDNLHTMIEAAKHASSKEVMLSIVQSDALELLRQAGDPRVQALAQRMRMVFPLHTEEVHVLANRQFVRLEDLQGARLTLPPKGSGSALTARHLLKLAHITAKEITHAPAVDAVLHLVQGRTDAVILVGGKPLRIIKNLEKLRIRYHRADAERLDVVHLLPVDHPDIVRVYPAATLTPEDYSLIAEPITTVSVNAILMSYYPRDRSLHARYCWTVARLAQVIRTLLPHLRANGHPKWRAVQLDTHLGLWRRDRCAWPDSAEAAPISSHHADTLDLHTVLHNAMERTHTPHDMPESGAAGGRASPAVLPQRGGSTNASPNPEEPLPGGMLPPVMPMTP